MDPEPKPPEDENNPLLPFILTGQKIKKPEEEAATEDAYKNLLSMAPRFGELGKIAAAEAPRDEAPPTDPSDPGDKPPADPKPEDKPTAKKVAYKRALPTPAPTEPPAAPATPPGDTMRTPQADLPPSDDAADEQDDPYSPEDRSFLQGLTQEERDEAEFWRQAELVDPKTYKGAVSRHLKFLRDHAEKLIELEDGDEPPAENAEYQRWLKKNKPSISAAEARRIDREIIAREAEERVAKKYKSEFEQIKAKQAEAERQRRIQEVALPKVRQGMSAFHETYVEDLSARESMKEAMSFYAEALDSVEATDPTERNKLAFEKFAEEFPVEAETIMEHYTVGFNVANRYLNLRHGVEDVNPNNPVDMSIVDQIHNYEQEFLSNPELKKARIRDGKQFASSADMARMNPEERAKHWTFGPDEIVRFMREEVAQKTEIALKKKVDTFQRWAKKHSTAGNSTGATADNPGEEEALPARPPRPARPSADPAGVTGDESSVSKLFTGAAFRK